MIKSQIENDPSDFDIYNTDDHIDKVYKKIEDNFEKYFGLMIEKAPSFLLHSKLGGAKKDEINFGKIAGSLFNYDIVLFEEEREKYLHIFSDDSLQEFLEDPNAFKAALQSGCPIIRQCIFSKRQVMREWQKSFKLASGSDLLQMFVNLTQFAKECKSNYKPEVYFDYDKYEEFKFDELDEEGYGVPGVIGTGIKSVVLYNFYPEIFPSRTRIGLYGLYFLTDMEHFDLPSRTSEFLMINDLVNLADASEKGRHNYKMDQNYWYSYGPYTLYALRIYKLIKNRYKEEKIQLNDELKYVYVKKFMESICKQYDEQIRSMLGGDDE